MTLAMLRFRSYLSPARGGRSGPAAAPGAAGAPGPAAAAVGESR